MLPLEFSNHSVSAFAERVSRLDSPDDVRREISQLLRTGVVTKAPPSWVNSKHKQKAQAFLILGDGDGEMALPLYRNRRRPGTSSNGRRKDVFITGTVLVRDLSASRQAKALDALAGGIHISTIGRRR